MTRGIYRRGNIYWIRYAGIDGKITYESSGSTKFRDAEALLISRKQDVKEGKRPEIKKASNYTFRELASEYLKWAERQSCFKVKKGHISEFLVKFGNLPLKHFKTITIAQYQTELLNKGYKPSTCNRYIATLKHMFTQAVDWDMVGEEVLKGLRKAKMLRENNTRLRYLSKDECQKLVDSCEAHLRPIVITALNTGMRKTEVLSIKREYLDLKNGFILLPKTKNGEKREIPITETLRQTLKNHTNNPVVRIDIPYVFYDVNTGNPYKDVKRSFKTACRRSGITDFHFHDLRHTFASHFIMSGGDITSLKEILGHKSLAMTMRYAHLAQDHKVKALRVFDNVFNENNKVDETPTIQKPYNLEVVCDSRNLESLSK